MPSSSISPPRSAEECAVVPLATSPTGGGSAGALVGIKGTQGFSPGNEQGCLPGWNDLRRSKEASAGKLSGVDEGFESAQETTTTIDELSFAQVGSGFGVHGFLLCFGI